MIDVKINTTQYSATVSLLLPLILQQLLKPVLLPLLLLILLLLTPTQTNPTHLSPERSGSDCLIRREGSVKGPAGAGEKGLKELLTHLNSHPCTLAHTHPGL